MLPLLAALALTSSPKQTSGPRVDEFLTNISQFGYAGTVCVFDHGKEVFAGGYGLANRSTGARNERNTVFDIGSLTKSFTATAILQLQEKGKLKLDDTIDKYLVGVPDDKKAITIRQLLSHTAGLDSDFPFGDNVIGYYEEVSRDEAIKRILAMSLISKPGEMYSYSNVGYILLAAIVEETSGSSFHDYIRKIIFAPAGMTSSGFWGSELPHVPNRLIAHSYENDKDTGNPAKLSPDTWMDQGGGEMVSTAPDLYRFLKALLDDRLVSKQSRELMWTVVKGNYGLGWFIDNVRDHRRIEHGGDYLGFGSELEWFPDKQIAVVVLANTGERDLGTRHIVGKIVPQILMSQPPYQAFKGDHYAPPPTCTDISKPIGSKIAGQYNTKGGQFLITREGTSFQISARGQAAINVLLDADHDEADHLDALSETSQRMIAELAQGKSETLAHSMRRPDLLASYRTGTLRAMKEWQEELGPLKAIRCVGTAPSAFPHGGFRSLVEFEYSKGTRAVTYGWMHDRILFSRGAEAGSPYSVTLKQGNNRKLVGWDIITFRGFEATPSKNALTIKSSNRSAVARRSD